MFHTVQVPYPKLDSYLGIFIDIHRDTFFKMANTPLHGSTRMTARNINHRRLNESLNQGSLSEKKTVTVELGLPAPNEREPVFMTALRPRRHGAYSARNAKIQLT
jgi:hypothetical protein